jgi:hypothetical protein
MKRIRSEAAIASRVERVLRLFSYILLGAPDFPEEDETDSEKETTGLLARLAELREQIQDLERRRWIDLTIGEVEEARQLFRAGDVFAAKRQLTSAEEHFKSWVERSRADPAFIVDSDGNARKL